MLARATQRTPDKPARFLLSAPTPPESIDLAALRLDDARALLDHSAQPSAREPGETPLDYMQRVIDGLCELSQRDPLTGLANRRHFRTALERSIEAVARSGESVLLLLLDIDHFKAINDGHGHHAGDQVLRAIASCLTHCVRPMDTVARHGGEEFAILLPNCQPAYGQAVAERIRRAVERLKVPVSPVLEVRATASLGGAYAPEWVRSTAELWLERADLQLYNAKRAGRNRAFIDLPRQVSVSAEEKGLLFSAIEAERTTATAFARTTATPQVKP